MLSVVFGLFWLFAKIWIFCQKTDRFYRNLIFWLFQGFFILFNSNFQLTKCDPDFIIPNGFDENDKKTRDKCLYLKQLLADKNIISRMPGTFLHMERLLDDGKSHEIHSFYWIETTTFSTMIFFLEIHVKIFLFLEFNVFFLGIHV